MATYSMSRAAVADLDDIWEYLAQDSLRQADKRQDRIFDACQKLANNTQIGRARSELRSGLRSFLAKPYILFYTIESGEGITVRRIIHYSRDLDALF